MEARLKVWKSGGCWWWEIRTHDTVMITPDRYVDGGTAGTWDAAWGDAELGWIHYMRICREAAA